MNNDSIFTSHNIFNKGSYKGSYKGSHINGYCFVYQFDTNNLYKFKWGVSVCDKSDQYNKKIGRDLAIKHMNEQKLGYAGYSHIGDVALAFILDTYDKGYGIWKNVEKLPKHIQLDIIASIDRTTYPVRIMTYMVRSWIVHHTYSTGIRLEYSIPV